MNRNPSLYTFHLALLTVSSLFYILSFPNFNLSFLAWVALVPLAIGAIDESPAKAFRMGWLSGTLAYMGLLYWILVTFKAANLSLMLSIPCWMLLSGYLGLYWGAWAAFLSFAFRVPSCGLTRNAFPIFGAAGWVALEYLRTFLFSGFPWTLLADSQVHHLALIQIASETGVYGVSFLVVLVNLTVVQGVKYLWLCPHPPPPKAGEGRALCLNLCFMSALIIVVFAWGHHRLVHQPAHIAGQPDIKVALLQGNIDQYKKWDVAFEESIKETYADYALAAANTHPDLIVWPETSVPGYLLQDKELTPWLIHLVRDTHTNHIVGAPAQEGNDAYNAAFALNGRGDITGFYYKQHLVPFGEMVPMASLLGRLIHVLNDLGGFTPGKSPALLGIHFAQDMTLVGVSICYEAIFPQLVRNEVQAGATLLANITNDGWYMQTAAPYQHFAPNIFRAVENDRWLVRADNTGISAIISPRGEIIMASPIFQSALMIGTVQIRHTHTFYTRHGDFFAWLCILAILFSIFPIDFRQKPRYS